jgi:hypothetical protein
VFLAVFTNVLGDNLISIKRKTDPSIISGNHFYFYFFNYFFMLSFGLMFIPATYLIEMKGIKYSVFLGMCLTTVGLWLNEAGLMTPGHFFNGLGMPFIFFTATKVSAMWFGPKGRNLTTSFLILGYFIPQTIEEFLDDATA